MNLTVSALALRDAMNFSIEKSGHSWQPVTTSNTTLYHYWINWRFFPCSVYVLISIFTAFFLIRKYEVWGRSSGPTIDETPSKTRGVLFDHELWRPCFRGIHPAWLLGFRVLAFSVLLCLLIANAIVDGGRIFYYYTQWTFTSITVFFALGSVLSAYGCYQYHNRVGGHEIESEVDTEQGISAEEKQRETSSSLVCNNHPTAGICGYILQILFQVNAGAVLLTDFVFWFIIFPFLAIKDYGINIWLITMHSINAIFLLGDTLLNSLRFPWFRIAYFLLWTSLYVIFQWLLHACKWLWWPYPFLDLSLPWAPLWYLSVGLMHVPCYGIFALIMKFKDYLFGRCFPGSYQTAR